MSNNEGTPVSPGTDNMVDTGTAVPAKTFLIPNQRAHFAFVVVRSFRIAFAILISLILGSMSGLIAAIDEGGLAPALVIGLFAGLCLLVALFVFWWSYLSWKRFSWEVTTTELNIYSGVVFRKNEHISITRIHSIDHKQSLIQRALGVVELKVTTASGSRDREAKIDGITLAEAENLSRVIFAQKHELEAQGLTLGTVSSGTPVKASDMVTSTKEALADPNAWITPGGVPGTAGSTSGANGEKADLAASVAHANTAVRGVFGGAASDQGPVEFEYRLSTKDLILTGLSSNNVLYFLFIVPLVLIGFVSDLGLGELVFNYISRLSFVVIIVAIVISIVIGWIFSVSHALLSYGGFTVRRRGKRIEVDRGILERHSVGIAIDRVQSVRVSRGLIRRMIGYAEVTVDTVLGISTEGEVNKAAIVHPFVKASEVDTFIAELLPEFHGHPQPTTPLPRKAFWRLIFRSTFWVTVFGVIPSLGLAHAIATDFTGISAQTETAIIYGSLAVAVLVIAICVFCGTMLFRARKWGTNESMIAIQKGLLSRDVIYVSRRKVQWARVGQTWFQKRKGLVTFKILTAAGSPGTGTPSVIKDVTAEQGDQLLAWAWPPLTEELRPPEVLESPQEEE